MENVELTIAVGVVIFTYKGVEITARQEDLDSPFSFEFKLDDKTMRRKTRTTSLHTVARQVRTRVDQELRKRRQPPLNKRNPSRSRIDV